MISQKYKLITLVGNILQRQQFLIFSRKGHTIRGKPPGVARSLADRLKEENAVDPEVARRINIGFPKLRPKRSLQLKERILHLKTQRNNSELEKQARSETLIIDLNEVKHEHVTTAGQFHLRRIADHYGVFSDLFGDAYFIPRVPLNIKYLCSRDAFHPVHCGNIIMPLDAKQKPEVSFNGRMDLSQEKDETTDNYWSLLLTNPDGHFSGEEKEYIHWFIGNIPNGEVNKGEEIVPYLQPIPPRGLGYQRFIFVLYKQEGRISFSEYKITEKCNLDVRTFSTKEFYRQNEEKITPAGLSFFQATWDKSTTEFYHKELGIREPVYEYDFPAPYIADQKWFPLRQPFNLYMDKHRDPKQVHKDYLESKLAKTHPFEGPEPPLRFPNAHPLRDIPSWLKTEIRKERLKIGRINDI